MVQLAFALLPCLLRQLFIYTLWSDVLPQLQAAG